MKVRKAAETAESIWIKTYLRASRASDFGGIRDAAVVPYSALRPHNVYAYLDDGK
jgi:hypothetical protein